jgi:dGTPase
MAAVGLVHDFGNPPFGHQGERAIGRWFRESSRAVFGDGTDMTDQLKQDFSDFNGNAQTLRLVTRLQIQGDEFGLNLTYGTLAALLKYTVRAADVKEGQNAGRTKPGFFASEQPLVEEIWEKTGLQPGQRHPLAYLVEACDDIAYSVMDIEDTVKKDLASYADVCGFLRERGSALGCLSPVIQSVTEYADKHRLRIKESAANGVISPGELDDLSMQRFRVACISQMIEGAIKSFVDNFESIGEGSFNGDLLESSPAIELRGILKEFLGLVTFPHRSILEIELTGAKVISGLMDVLWESVISREPETATKGKRSDPLHAYVYSRVSENYRRVFETSDDTLPLRYREAQLLTDMISGMTDTFAVSLYNELKPFVR